MSNQSDTVPFVLILSKSGRKYPRQAASLAIAHKLAVFAKRAGYEVVRIIPRNAV